MAQLAGRASYDYHGSLYLLRCHLDISPGYDGAAHAVAALSHYKNQGSRECRLQFCPCLSQDCAFPTLGVTKAVVERHQAVSLKATSAVIIRRRSWLKRD